MTSEHEAIHLRTRSDLLAVIAAAANGQTGALEANAQASRAWREGHLTAAEMAGIGTALLAVERQA